MTGGFGNGGFLTICRWFGMTGAFGNGAKQILYKMVVKGLAFGVEFVYQVVFFFTAPLFDFLFASDGVFDILETLVINKVFAFVLPGESMVAFFNVIQEPAR
jgi:hypothetical protein